MQLLTILILVTLPIIFAQFLTDRIPAFTSNDKDIAPTIEALYKEVVSTESDTAQRINEDTIDKVDVAFQGEVFFLLDDEFENSDDKIQSSKFIPNISEIEHTVTEQVNQKKVRLVKGKQHVQGMDFLSVILMLKEKQK